MFLIRQDAGEPCDVVVVNKGHQVFAPVDTPLVGSELAVQRVGDLKQVHRIEAGIDTLIAFVVRAAMQHLVIYNQVIVSEEYLSDQYEVIFKLLDIGTQSLHEITVQTIGNVQTQSVDVEGVYPKLDTFQEIINNGRVLKIQLHQFKMTFPAFVPKSVVVSAVTVKVNMEPVFIRGVPFLLLNILKSPESASYMVKDTVQDDLYTVLVKTLADFCKILVRAETTVYLSEITGIIAVIV